MSPLLDHLDDDERELTRETPQPDTVSPMLAVLTDEPFDDDDWIYERKLDGVRIVALRKDGRVRLVSRHGTDRSATYFEVRDALAGADAPDLVADGEVVAFAGDVSSFRRLQERMQISDEAEARARAETVKVHFYAFDLLHLEGRDVTRLPLRRRKALLRRALDFSGPVRFTNHRNGDGLDYLHDACDRGWEGLIAKRAASRYVHARSTDWLKFKCVSRQELVIGGFTEPGGSRKGFGALLVGYYADGELHYAGKVGTGYDDALLESLRSTLDRLERKTPPFDAGGPLPRKDVHWVTPRLVGEVGFTEWTPDGRLRHPRFLGLRDDKDAADVVREVPQHAPAGVRKGAA